MTEREKQIAIARLARDDVTSASEDPTRRLSSIKALKQAVKKWKTWMFVVGYMVCRPSLSLEPEY